jgi:hypothetical protein
MSEVERRTCLPSLIPLLGFTTPHGVSLRRRHPNHRHALPPDSSANATYFSSSWDMSSITRYAGGTVYPQSNRKNTDTETSDDIQRSTSLDNAQHFVTH